MVVSVTLATPLESVFALGADSVPGIRREVDRDTRDALPGAAFDARRNHRRPAGCAERLRRCGQHDVIDRRAPDQQILDLP